MGDASRKTSKSILDSSKMSSDSDMTDFSSFDNDILKGLMGQNKTVTPTSIREAIRRAGILDNDPRLSTAFASLAELDADAELSLEQILAATSHDLRLLHQISAEELVIGDFEEFSGQLHSIFDQVEPEKSGKNADYVPILRDADSEKFGMAFCSVHGQFIEIGDSRELFTVQSTSKPLTFAMALEQLGAPEVLKWCGIEPSGRPFNDMTLLPDKRPYNPMVNSGALMTAASLASAHPDLAKRDAPTEEDGYYGKELYDEVIVPEWRKLSGEGIVGDVGFSDETFVSERETADNNLAISFFLKSNIGMRGDINVNTMVDLYLRACSTTASAASMAVVASTLANGGKNPFSGDQILTAETVKRTLSVMSFCGFYDNAGEFFFDTGIPSKSGVSGVVFLVLPNVGGFAIFSPRLDSFGNSVRGSLFAKKLVDLFTFHSFDSLTSFSTGCKFDPRFSFDYSQQRAISRIRWGVRAGDKKSLELDSLLLDVCVRVASADGVIDDEERKELRETYFSILQSNLKEEDLSKIEKDLNETSPDSQLDDLYTTVSVKEKELDDIEKEIILEAAFKISIADGKLEDDEKKLLTILAKALKVSEDVLDLKISTWERELV